MLKSVAKKNELFYLTIDKVGNLLTKEQYISTIGMKEKYEASPIILMHGLLGSSQNYISLMNTYCSTLLSKYNRRAFLLDVRNHGRSEHVNSMTYDDLSDDIMNLMDELNIEKVNLVGHSMSGKATMNLLLREKLNNNTSFLNRIEKAIVVDISPVDYTRDNRWSIHNHVKAMKQMNLSKIKTRADADRQLKELSNGTITSDVRGFLLMNLTRVTTDSNSNIEAIGWKWRCNLDIIEQYLIEIGGFPFKLQENHLAELFPTVQYNKDNILVMRGSKSMYVTDKYEETTNHFFPQHTLKTIDKAGHWTHVDNPKDFIKTVGDFIDC
ncbi:hypothetical protein ABK040_000132 [Willaertia magna]